MPKATMRGGDLIPIDNCYIDIPSLGCKIVMKTLPDLSDSKSASYADEAAIGRAMPFKNYSNSDNRSISWTCHFMVCKQDDIETILGHIHCLEACTYPSNKVSPYAPPPICKIKCGRLLAEDELCVVLKNYSVKFDSSLPWDIHNDSYLPHRVDMDLQFEVVYDQSDLPYAERIMSFGK